jgi:hypothetical protein
MRGMAEGRSLGGWVVRSSGFQDGVYVDWRPGELVADWQGRPGSVPCRPVDWNRKHGGDVRLGRGGKGLRLS